MLQAAGGSYLPHLAFCQDPDCAVGVGVGVGWVRQLKMRRARLSCRLLVADVAKYIQTHTRRHIYTYAEVVVVAVFVAVAVRPTPFASCVKARWQHNLRY